MRALPRPCLVDPQADGSGCESTGGGSTSTGGRDVGLRSVAGHTGPRDEGPREGCRGKMRIEFTSNYKFILDKFEMH